MHKLKLLLAACALVGFISTAPVGCKSPEQAALVAVTAANSAGDLAAAGYLAYCEQNHLDPAAHPDIVQAARGYKAAKLTAQAAVVAWKSTQTADAKTKLDAALAAAASAETNLISLVRLFNPSLVK